MHAAEAVSSPLSIVSTQVSYGTSLASDQRLALTDRMNQDRVRETLERSLQMNGPGIAYDYRLGTTRNDPTLSTSNKSLRR